jgi:hypothetical protein
MQSTRPRGPVRSGRLPVTQEIVGSNPIGGARQGTQTGKAAKLKPSRLCRFDSDPCHSLETWSSRPAVNRLSLTSEVDDERFDSFMSHFD